MFVSPPESLVDHIHEIIYDILSEEPWATSSEALLQHYIEFELLMKDVDPSYVLRIGINYHGQKVQHLRTDGDDVLVGWNPTGDALGTGEDAKVLLAGHTIFDRADHEPMMSDTKVGGAGIPQDRFVRIEFKTRGWLGKTKNLDGAQLEKDLDLLKDGDADLLVICLSETAHRKWRGEGPKHHASRRVGVDRFSQFLIHTDTIQEGERRDWNIIFEGQPWRVSCQCVAGNEIKS